MTVIRLRGVVVVLGRYPALAGLDLEVKAQETVLLQGPNGAGKSTLLGLCAGLHPLRAGSAAVLGCDLAAERPAVRGRVGLLGHDTALYDDLTVAENLELWARAARLPVAEVPEALDRLGLGARLRSVPAGRLSAGQRRRTALAAIALRRPELWLLDEPHAGLDRSARRIVDELIAEAAASGATVVLSSHDPDSAGGPVDRTVTLTGGTVTADAT